MDYVAFEAETTEIVKTAASVSGGDNATVTAQKIADWQAAGGLLTAIVAGDFDTASSVITGDTSDLFVDNVTLDASGAYFSEAIVSDIKSDANRHVPNRGAKSLQQGDRITDSAISVLGDLDKYCYHPAPNRQAWVTDYAKVNSLKVGWTGTAWESRAALNPTFGSATAVGGGYTIQISNYSSDWTYTPVPNHGFAYVNGSGLVTVYGLTSHQTATMDVKSSRPGYPSGTGNTSGTAKYDALTPTFGTPTRTADGYTVSITNYDAAYTWAGSATASGSVSINAGTGLVTVTGVAANTESVTTVTTTRAGYVGGTASVSGTSLSAARTPTFGTPTSTSGGFTVQITNYDAAWTWAGTATASGTVTINGSGLATISGVAGTTSSTATITATRSGYVTGSATSTATSL